MASEQVDIEIGIDAIDGALVLAVGRITRGERETVEKTDAVEAEKDDVIPPQVIQNFITAFRQPKSLTSRKLTGADHGLSSKTMQSDYNAVLVKWLTEMIVGARAGDAASLVEQHKQAAPSRPEDESDGQG